MYTSTDDPIEIARTFSRLNEWTGAGGGKSNDCRETGGGGMSREREEEEEEEEADGSGRPGGG